MTVIIRIVAAATGEAGDLDGLFLREYDPDAHDGRGVITGTRQREHALQFADPGAALACWRQTSKVRPLRPDGRPNRPLTAYTVEVQP